MPDFDGSAARHVVVEAPPKVTFDALTRADLLRSPRVRAVQGLRRFLDRVSGGGHAPPTRDSATVEQFAGDAGWTYLGSEPGHEVVYGAIGRADALRDRARAFSPEAFAGFDEPRHVKATWNLSMLPYGSERSLLSAEMRWRATDDATRARYKAFWTAGKPAVVLLLDTALDVVRAEAEIGR